jgi:hypothetical protein
MNPKQNLKSGIEQELSSINMSERMRSVALHDARFAEAFVEVFSWAGSKINRPYADGFAKASPKY